MSLTRSQLLFITAAGVVAILISALLTSMLLGQFNLFANGTAFAAPADTPSASTSPSPSASPVSKRCDSHVNYYATDASKEYEFGPPVIVNTDDSVTKARVLSVMQTRFCKGDPALTSAVQGYTAYVHTGNSGELLNIDEQTSSFVGNRDEWRDEANTLIAKLQDARFTTENVPANSWSLYMVRDGDTYDVHQGKTVADGTAAVFTTDDGDVYEFRLDCGLQPVRIEHGRFPSVPSLPSPPHSTPSTPKPTQTLQSKIPSQDPNAQGHAGQGGGKNKDPGPGKRVAPSDAPTPPPTQRTNPAPPSSAPVSSSEPVPAPTRTVPPPEQGAPVPSDAPSTCVPPPGESSC